ncbi:MAG: outer membrane beta-barrel protein [Flavobacteriales bacterium]|jgi:hypothetical protein|nr:outer membrane beta-barrel protein [Flavobacteriales bacterium]MCB0759659.1 hypothetical protein [Flavobacteriales bacterium]
MKRILFPLAALALLSSASAQVNTKGALQFGIGLDLGVHATHFENELTFAGLTKKDSNRDGAVTVTVPIEAQLGLADRFSLGLYIEPGSYLDSAGTHPNKLFLAGLSPRYYAVNKDRFALYFHADLGFGTLKIGDVQNGAKRYDDRYAGGHFRLGLATQWYFGDAFGINLGLKYAATSFKWKDRDPSDPVLGTVGYSAKLKTSGIQFQVGLQVKI